jgi:hypothetical protein
MLETDYRKLLGQADKLDQAFCLQFSLDFLGNCYLPRSLLYGKHGKMYYHLYLLDASTLVYIDYTAALNYRPVQIIQIKTLRGLNYNELKHKLGWYPGDLLFYPKRCDIAALTYIANNQHISLLDFEATDLDNWPVYTASDLRTLLYSENS